MGLIPKTFEEAEFATEADVKPRTFWQDRRGTVRVMGIVQGWVVARRKGAAPFLTFLSDFVKTFKPY